MRKLIALILVAASIVATDMARAAFDQSLPEFKKAVADNPLLSAPERDSLPKAYEDYIEARNKALKDLLEILKDTDAGNKEQQRKFEDRTESVKGELKKYSDSLGSPDKLSPTALGILNEITLREGRFFDTLKGLKVAEQRDAIVEQRRRMVEMSDLLETKWKGLLDLDDNLDKQEQQLVQEMQKFLDEAIKYAAAKRQNIYETLGKASDILSKFSEAIPENAPGIIKLIAIVNEAITDLLTKWVEAQDFTEQRIAAYTNLAKSEQFGVYVIFSQVRRDTELFVQQNGFDKAKERYAKAKDDLDRLPDNYSGSGPKADAAEFAKLALEAINDHLKAFEEAFNNFVRKHEKKFFGPLGPDVREELLETQIWDRLEDQQRGLDLDEKLRAWRSDVKGFFEVSLSGLSDVEREWISKQLKDNFDKLSLKLQQIDEQLAMQRLKDRLFNRKSLGDGLK